MPGSLLACFIMHLHSAESGGMCFLTASLERCVCFLLAESTMSGSEKSLLGSPSRGFQVFALQILEGAGNPSSVHHKVNW